MRGGGAPQKDSSWGAGDGGGFRVIFISEPFGKDTEITGEIKLNLWISSTIDDVNVHANMLLISDGAGDRGWA